MSSIPSSSGTGSASSAPGPAQPPRLVPLAILVGLIAFVAGGFATGYLLTKHSVLGIAILGVGVAVGWISRRITGSPSRVAAQCLVAACVLSFCLAMVSWYRWGITLTLEEENHKPRDPTWREAVVRAPKALLQFKAPDTLLITGVCAAFGAAEVYRLAGRRYRWVAVEE